MSRHIIKMKHPASWHGELWRDALRLGNGLTGALIHGAIAEETIQFARHDLWHHGDPGGQIPDISDTFRDMRAKIDAGDYRGANTNLIAKALKEAGYTAEPHVPCPLGDLKCYFDPGRLFKGYERGIDMRAGEAFVCFRIGDTAFERRAFVSRADDIAVISMKAEEAFTTAYQFVLLENENAVHEIGGGTAGADGASTTNGHLAAGVSGAPYLRSRSADGLIGADVAFIGDIETSVANNRLVVTGNEYLILVKVFANGVPADETIQPQAETGTQAADAKTASGTDGQTFDTTRCSQTAESADSFAGLRDLSYEELLARHTALHTPLYDSVSMELASEEEHDASNEQLLEEAYEDVASPALLEKMWRFGRYLFISAASENGLPVALYGIWPGQDDLPWTQYVANENVEMTYWHVLTGGLSYSLKPLIRYYMKKLDVFKDCAKKIFGMSGAWLSAYTSPGVSGPCVPVGVIANWIGCGGWLAQHFWDYYCYTGDEKALREDILPFMHEAALFYQDYITYDETGRMQLYPSVSPENSPGNLMPAFFSEDMGHVAPAVKNATMDFAIMKEFFTNFLQGIEITGLYADEAADYQALLHNIPPYMINEDGAVKEWMSPELKDHYYHRHLSHIYPVFPGKEVNRQNAPELFAAFKQAVNLRELGGQSGWSLSHMSNIYARMGEPELAIECLDTLAKSAVNNALVTMHNDWRHMGMTLDLKEFAPVQLDANFGIVSALQEMLFYYGDNSMFILPALPKRFPTGHVTGLVFPQGTVDLEWTPNSVAATISAARNFTADVILRDTCIKGVTMFAGERYTLSLEV